MKAGKKILSGIEILSSRLTGHRFPVAVRFNLLYRCPWDCLYCEYKHLKTKELSTEQVVMILEQLARAGTTRISFSGGEPLLLKDIGKIVDAAYNLGISPTITTSGFAMDKRVHDLARVEVIKLSFDGPEEVHDTNRSKGSFKTVMHAIDLCKKHGIRFSLNTTISKYNVNHLPFLVDFAEKVDCEIVFQPIKIKHKEILKNTDFLPDQRTYRSAIDYLIEEKKKGNTHIYNSLYQLKYIRDWPDFRPIKCAAGRIFVVINPDGTLLPCDRITYDAQLPSLIQVPLKQALQELPEPRCTGCGFSGALDLNLLYSLKPWSLKEIVKYLKE